MDIDASVLKELKRRQKGRGKSLGRLVSELLARALAESGGPKKAAGFRWISRPMNERIDLVDKEALYAAMDKTG